MVKGKASKRKKSKSLSKSKKMSKAQARFRPRHTDLPPDETRDVIQSLRKDQEIKVLDIQKMDHIKEFDLYYITGEKGAEVYMTDDLDSMTEHAEASVGHTWYEYAENQDFKNIVEDHTDSKGDVDEEAVLTDFVKLAGADDILAGVDGMIHLTDDGKPYYLVNKPSRF